MYNIKMYHLSNVVLSCVIITLCFNKCHFSELDEGFCSKNDLDSECNSSDTQNYTPDERFIFYDVNPPEGFNLRRDVYMRMAVFAHNLKKSGKHVKLVLPPWNYLYHWRSKDVGSQKSIPWSLFFDLKSLQSFAPVIEMNEIMSKQKTNLVLDRIYVLKHFEDAFESGHFEEKWLVQKQGPCRYADNFWGYNNITTAAVECILFQGSASKLGEVLNLHKSDKMVMFTNAETALHDEYGTAKFWNVRKSMKFNKELVSLAEEFIEERLNCSIIKCDNYASVHWRRTDFARSRDKEVPSTAGTAKQIYKKIYENYKDLIKTVFIATDAPKIELDELIVLLQEKNLKVEYYSPSNDVKLKFKDGGVAIIEQIIASHATYFLGTHESTFTYRIQEEREIMGFNSQTTFNRLCPDQGFCEKPSSWKIVH